MSDPNIIILATRGSALALAQANLVRTQCQAAFPDLKFDIKIIKTTGDKLADASLAQGGKNLPKGLFTKELEVALSNGQADLAVHSLKDLPTDLPPGLTLGAVTRRVDVRDVLIYCNARQTARSGVTLKTLRPGATVGTSSTRRRAQLLAQRPDLNIVELRGNIMTRLQRLSSRETLDAIVLAAAGIERMNFQVASGGSLTGSAVPNGLSAVFLDIETMLPCIGQGALGIEIRDGDARLARICERLNHPTTEKCTAAERSFLAAMGGGCASPVAAYCESIGDHIYMRAISFPDGVIRRTTGKADRKQALELGQRLAETLKNESAQANVPARPPVRTS